MIKQSLIGQVLWMGLVGSLFVSQQSRAFDQVVTNLADTGAGSLRQAITDVGIGETISFDATLSGKTITLTGTQLLIQKSLIIDASSLNDGITIDGDGASRILQVDAGINTVLRNLTLTGGNATGAASSGFGGAICNLGKLEIHACTISGNSATTFGGGAIYNDGAVAELIVDQCTISGNNAAFAGGLLFRNGATAILDHCTVSNNTGSGGTGGMVIESTASVTINNTIVAQNAHTGVPSNSDIGGIGGTLIVTGNNIIGVQGSYNTVLPVGSPNINGDYVGDTATPVDAMLSALGDNGGPSATMLPLSGSPAIENTPTTPFSTDQRGFSRVINTNADIGAVEVQPNVIVTSLADTGAGSLREAIDNAAAAPTHTKITFDPSLLSGGTIPVSTTLNITQPLTIDASSSTGPLIINGGGAISIIKISQNIHATVLKITFTGGASPNNGGAIYADRFSHLALTDCNFTSNTSIEDGGAIYNYDSDLVITRGSFTSNSNTDGTNKIGGAIYNNGLLARLTITDSSFTNNTAGDDGGAIYNNIGTVDIENTQFTNNQTGTVSNTYGGAVFTSGLKATLTLANCDFLNNSAGTRGGAICAQGGCTVSVTDCSFTGNTALEGGAVYQTAATHFTMVNGDFTSNVANDGGAIFNTRGVCNLTGTTLDRNSTLAGGGNHGGAIYNIYLDTHTILTDCDIIDNSSGGQGGAIYSVSGSKLEIHTCRLERNECPDDGGGIFNDDSEIEITNSTLSANKGGTSGGDYGGALASYGYGSVIQITDCQLLDNTCGDDGGAIYLSVGKMTIIDSIFRRNAAIDDGNAICIIDGNVHLTSSEVSNHTSSAGGGRVAGAIYNIGISSDLTITDCSIFNNTSGDDGGAIYNQGSLTLTRTIFTSNRAGTGLGHLGGAVCNVGSLSSLTCTDSDFISNSSGDDGGAIFNFDGQVLITRCDFSGNTAGTTSNHHGGAIFNQGVYTILSLIDCDFVNNLCGDDGGAIYNADGLLAVSGTDFTGNNTLIGGGKYGGALLNIGIYASASFTDCNFTSNECGDDGGAIWNNAIMTFETTKFSLNKAGTGNGHSGGAILMFGSNSDVQFDNCELSGNTAGDDGGAIWNYEGKLSLTNTTLAGNTAGIVGIANTLNQGGAIFNNHPDADMDLTNCTLTNNTSGGYGGSIYTINATVHLLHVTITQNEALVSGGAIYKSNGSVTIENSIVAGNSSPTNPETNTTITELGTNFTSGDPLLAALGDFGGFARTMPPLPGSPVIEGTTSTPYPLDQRGAVRPNGPLPDIGAVEAFPFSNLTLVDTDNDEIDDRIESSYARYTVGVDDSALDSDGDGSTDAEEFANMSDPDDAMSYLKIVSFVPATGFSYPSNIVFDVTWTTFPGLNYTIERDDSLDFGDADILGPIVAEGFTRSSTVSFDNTDRDFISIRRN